MPDLPGLGSSDPVGNGNIGAVAEHMLKLLDHLQLDRATVVGHDFGGAVAWALGISHADRLEKLVVVNSPLRKLDLKRGWHMIFFNLPVLPELVFTLAGGKLVDLVLRAASSRKGNYDPAALDEYRAALRSIRAQRNAFAYYRTTTRNFIRNAISAKLPGNRGERTVRRSIDVPTMVVWGRKDPVLPVHLTEHMHRSITDLDLRVLEDVGHFVPEEAPDELAAALDDFVRAV